MYNNVTATFGVERNNYTVRAVDPDHQFIEKSEMKQGRFINSLDLANNTKNIVIGDLVANDLFGDIDPIGKYLDLNKIKFKVVGVFVERTEGTDSNEARIIYMPISTAQKIYGGDDKIDQINLIANFSVIKKITKDNKNSYSVVSRNNFFHEKALDYCNDISSHNLECKIISDL